jgi:CheY-like chemotaxis protein
MGDPSIARNHARDIFVVKMNRNEIPRAREPEARGLPARMGVPLHVLVVEDDDVLRETNADMLLRAGYQVQDAVDGAAAWDALSEGYYDLLITDNNMPRVSGLELLKRLHAARMGIPVIMATGTLPEEEFTRQPWLKPVATLLKPYTQEQMLEAVEKVLRKTADTAPGG